MKYGIIIIALITSAQMYGQQVRMHAKSFQNLSQSFATEQSVVSSNTVGLATSTSESGFATSNNETEFVYPTTSSTSSEISCDVVVQEELVAGRVAGSENTLGKSTFNFDKIKDWFFTLFHKKD